MNKITEIKVVGEGLQLKRLIKEANYTYQGLAERYNLETASLEKYLCKKQIKIGSFIDQMEDLFQKPYTQIVTPIEEQVKEYILNIKANIKQYNKASDHDNIMKLCTLSQKYCQPYEQLMAKGSLAIHKYKTGYHNHAKEILEEVVADSLKKDFKELTVYYSVHLAFLHLSTDKKKSRKRLETVEPIIEDEASREQLSNLTLFNYYHFYGVTLNRWGKHVEAREQFHKAVKYAEDDSNMAKALSNIGLTYYNDGIYRDAHDWYHKALDKALYHDDIKAGILNNIANLHMKKGKMGQAVQYIDASMKLVSREIDPVVKLSIYESYLDLHKEKGDKLLKDIIYLLDQCAVFNDNQQYIVNCLEKSLSILLENKDYENIQILLYQILKYSRLEGEKRPLNDLKAVAVNSIHYLEDEGHFNLLKAFDNSNITNRFV